MSVGVGFFVLFSDGRGTTSFRQNLVLRLFLEKKFVNSMHIKLFS